MTYVHKIWVEMSHHPTFAAKSFEKNKIFFKPQPPRDFGLAIWSHFTQGSTFFSFFPIHRNIVQIIYVLFKIDLGIHASAIQ